MTDGESEDGDCVYDTIGYDTIGEFNVDSKAEYDQLNLAHETKTNDSAQTTVQAKVNQAESEQDEVDGTKNAADSTGKVMYSILYY